MRKSLTPNVETDSSGPSGPAAVGKEIRRKIFHLCTLLYLAAYFLIGPERVMVPMLAWLAVVLAFELVRLHTARGYDWIQRTFGFMIREKEAKHFTGFFYTSLGVMLAFLFFGRHPQVVSACLLYLALGDSASAVVGVAWGRRPYWIFGRKRTWEGSAAGFCMALAIGAGMGMPPPLILACALAFSAADILPLPPDDNVWIPVLPGLVLMGSMLLGGPAIAP